MTWSTVAAVFVDHFGKRQCKRSVIPEPPLSLFPGVDGTEGIEKLMREVAELFEMELSLLGHVNGERYTTLAYYARDGDFPISQGAVIPIGETYCRQEITADAPFVLGDAALEEGFEHHPGFRQWGLRAYVGVPVRLPDGVLLGTLCAVDRNARYPSLDNLERLVEIADAIGKETARRLRAQPPAGPV